MAELKDKIQHALNEGRILVLGTQVLIGFQYRLAFENSFERLAPPLQGLEMVALFGYTLWVRARGRPRPILRQASSRAH